MGLVCLQGDENIGGANTVLSSNLLDDFVLVQWRVLGAQRGVRGQSNALGLAELDDVGLVARPTNINAQQVNFGQRLDMEG